MYLKIRIELFLKMIWKYLQYIDFMSIDSKLYLKGKERYNSKFGILMSILALVSIMVLGVFFFFYFFDNKLINVLYYVDTKDYSGVQKLNGKPFFFRLFDISGQNFDPRIAMVTPLYFKRQKGVATTQLLKTEICSFEKNINNSDQYQTLLKSVNLSMWTCFNQDLPLNLTQISSENIQYYFVLYVSPCSNSSNFNNCYSPDIITNKLNNSNFYIEYYFPSYSIDHSNVNNPIEETVLYRSYKVFPNMYNYFYEYMKIVNYTSDQGAVMESYASWQLYGRDPVSSYQSVAISGTNIVPNSFTVILILLNSNNVDRYSRSFQKLQTVISNIGGAYSIIMIVSSFITQFITSKFLYIELLNEFVYVEDSNDFSKNEIEIEGIKSTSNALKYNNFINNSNLKSNFDECKIKNPIVNKSTIIKEGEVSLPLENINNNFQKTFSNISYQKIISIKEILCPRRFLKESSILNEIEIFSEIVRDKISTDGILKLFRDVENIKYLMLDENQLILFDYIKNKTLQEQSLNSKQIFKSKLNEILKNLSTSNDPLNIKLLRKMSYKIL